MTFINEKVILSVYCNNL